MKTRTCSCIGAFALVALAMVGCATAGKTTAKAKEKQPSPEGTAATKVNVATEGGEHLGLVVRRMGAESGVGIVLMQGLEWRQTRALNASNQPLGDVAQQLAAEFNGKVQTCPAYVFLYPTGYEMLEQVSLAGALDPSIEELPLGIAFGAGTPMYTVLAMIGRTLKTTLVADNAIAQAECGELSLPEMPLRVVLEAVLKSARVPGDAIEVRSDAQSTFIHSRGLPTAESVVLNESTLTDEQRGILDARVSVELPYPQSDATDLTVFPGASTLEEILPSLSRQLGVTVTAEPALAKVPVNPMVAHEVPRGMVLELLIRQWLEPFYGYTVEPDRIVIRRNPQS
jgi:hypothetical protein